MPKYDQEIEDGAAELYETLAAHINNLDGGSQIKLVQSFQKNRPFERLPEELREMFCAAFDELTEDGEEEGDDDEEDAED